MQNRYAGDIGDFGKLGLLRILQSTGLTIGVNWYLTPDENHNSDGRFVQYLENRDYCQCDEQLWKELGEIIHSEQRQVYALQKNEILKASYFSEPLSYLGKSKAERKEFRTQWHQQALKELKGVDIIFVDPDNGLIVPSAEGTLRENKYVFPSEIIDYYKQGSSVIYYQHKARKRDSFYMNQQKQLMKSLELQGAGDLAMKFTKTSQRYYFFVLQSRHQEIVTEAMHNMISFAWQNLFCIL